MVPAARMMCSRFERVIDVPSLLRIQHSGERARLPQFDHSRTVFFNYGQQVCQGPLKQFAPFVPIGLRIAPQAAPAVQIVVRDREQLRLFAELGGDGAMQCEASAFQVVMRQTDYFGNAKLYSTFADDTAMYWRPSTA